MTIRRTLVNAFRKALPPLSRTEREALESGTIGWDGELMSGHPDWKKLFALNKPQLTADEQAFLDGPVEKLCEMMDSWQIHKDQDLPKPVWDFIRNEGFLGLEVPKEYGGKGFSSQAHSAVVMKLASRNVTGAVSVMIPNSVGPAALINAYGTKEQKDHYLPRLAKGLEIPCFALTGPDAGSDAGAIPDKGVVCKNEKGELGIRLNWEKRYITLGPVATLLGLAFKLEDPDNLLGTGKKDLGITVALVPRDTPGVEIGARHRMMDMAFQNGPNSGRDVFIPADNIIGGPARAGQGWKMLMESLAVGRSLSLPALSTSAAKFASHITGAYSRVRKQFNTPIGKFQGVEEKLGRMAGLTYMMNASRAATLQMVDQGERPAIPSAILKYHLTENMRRIVNDAMDVHGGKGVANGPSNLLSELYTFAPITITVEGANIMTRNLIIFGQGSVRAHPYVLKEMEAANNNDDKAAFKSLTGLLLRHAANTVRSAAKAWWYGLTGGLFSRVPKDTDPRFKRHYKQVNRLSAAFNLASDATLLALGGGLKLEERTSARLGDVFSNLYLASCTLWHFEKQGRPKEDAPLADWACRHALDQAEQALDELLRNHPRAMVGKLLRPLVLPLGRRNKAPDDALEARTAETIRSPGPARDRLSEGLYLPKGAETPLGKLEAAFALAVETEPLEKKLRAVGELTPAEREKLAEAARLRSAVVTVDAFPQPKQQPAPPAA
jgi:acyl-CoA dehydrogenase